MLQVQWVMASFRCYDNSDVIATLIMTSSETQGQIVGARESLNGRENMARRKVKNGENSRFLLWVSEDVIMTNFHLYLIQLWWQFFANVCL